MIRASFPSKTRNLAFPGSYENPISISMPQNDSGRFAQPHSLFSATRVFTSFLQQRVGQKLIRREPNRSPRSRKAFEFLLELLDHTRPCREKAAMVLERRVSQQHFPVLKHRDSVADNL